MLDEAAAVIVKQLNRVLFLRQVASNEQIAEGRRLKQLNRQAKERYDQ